MKITKRVLKFDLVLDGEKINSLDELRAHPSTELLEMQKDGRLSRWLRAHGGTSEADKLCEMSPSGDTAHDLYAICQVLAFDLELEDIIDALKDESQKDTVPACDSVEEDCLCSDQVGSLHVGCMGGVNNAEHNVLAEFDAEVFLKFAMITCTRLLGSWDRRDIEDIFLFATKPVVDELYRLPNPGQVLESESHPGERGRIRWAGPRPSVRQTQGGYILCGDFV